MTSSVGNHVERRKKDSARLVWDTKPKRAPNPKEAINSFKDRPLAKLLDEYNWITYYV